jgi:ribosome-associated protein
MTECLKNEVRYKTSRSSGPGGQHVNKTESRVELFWDLPESDCLDDGQKTLLSKRLESRLTEGGMLILSCEEHRSQYQNRVKVTERFVQLVMQNLVPPKKRFPTKPTRTSVEKRLEKKKRRGEIKRSRGEKPEN